jgi:hypothetical protein
MAPWIKAGVKAGGGAVLPFPATVGLRGVQNNALK